MKIKNIIAGIVSCIIGFIIFVEVVDWVSKPSNVPLKFNYTESFKTYFFSFTYSLGVLGQVLGVIILALYFGLFFYLGYALLNPKKIK